MATQNTTDLIAKCPNKVWFDTLEYTILFVPVGHAALDAGETDGQVDFAACEIFVKQDLRLPELMETLWHEFTHVVNYIGDIEDGAIEEELTDKHAKLWSQFWINNPRFHRWWNSACTTVRAERTRTPRRK